MIDVNDESWRLVWESEKETDLRSLLDSSRLRAVCVRIRTGTRGRASLLGLVPTFRPQLHIFRLQFVHRFL